MDKQPKSPINLLTDALAAMTERAVDAERQRDAAKEDRENWYECYMEKSAQLYAAEVKLQKEIEEHQKTREALRHALSPAQKGEG